MSSSSTCNASCKQLFIFPKDPSSTNLGESEKLLPVPTGSVNASRPSRPQVCSVCTAASAATPASPTTASTGWRHSADLRAQHPGLPGLRRQPRAHPEHLHPGRRPGPQPRQQDNDYQDVVFLVSNVTPATAQGALPGAATTTDLTKGGTVGAGCAVTGFDGVLANTASTQCNTGNIAFTGAGLALTSTAGQLATNNQQKRALQELRRDPRTSSPSTRSGWTAHQLATDNQQVGAWFGPDQNNFVKVEAEHNGTGAAHLTMFYREKGVASTVASIALPALATASTVDLLIVGNTSVPDPATGGVHNFPLDELTVFYSIDGGTRCRSARSRPRRRHHLVLPDGQGRIEVSNANTTAPITATVREVCHHRSVAPVRQEARGCSNCVPGLFVCVARRPLLSRYAPQGGAALVPGSACFTRPDHARACFPCRCVVAGPWCKTNNYRWCCASSPERWPPIFRSKDPRPSRRAQRGRAAHLGRGGDA